MSETLTDLYNHLEATIRNYRWECEIQDQFKALRDKSREYDDTETADRSQWEIEFWGLCLKEGRALASWQGTKADGSHFAFPNMEDFDDRQLDYLEARLAASKHPVLRARYAQVLWNSRRRKGPHAFAAIDGYLDFLRDSVATISQHSWKEAWSRLLPSVINALHLARMAKYRTADVCDVVVTLRRAIPLGEPEAFPLFRDLVRVQLEDRSLFGTQPLDGVQDDCASFADAFVNANQLDIAIDCLLLGQDVSQSVSAEDQPFSGRIARLNEALAARDAKDGNWAAMTHSQEAEDYFARAGDKDGAHRMRLLREQLKSQLPLQEIRTPVDLSPAIEKHRRQAEDLCSSEPEMLMPVLSCDPGIVPSLKDVEALVDQSLEHRSFLNLVGLSPIDEFGNSLGDLSSEEGRRAYALSEQYRYALRFDKAILVSELVSAGLRHNLLNWSAVRDYLARNSWVGKDVVRSLPNGNVETYRWLDLLGPGLEIALLHLATPVEHSENSGRTILSIDTLVPKVEGMVRDICRMQGAITVKHKTKDGRTLEEEMGLGELLDDPHFRKQFSDDEVYFFKHILCDNLGWNLRNRLSHALLFLRHYNRVSLTMVLIVVLRLAKLDFEVGASDSTQDLDVTGPEERA